jgi:hypothetical protein
VNGNYRIVNGNYRIVNGKIVNGTARPPPEGPFRPSFLKSPGQGFNGLKGRFGHLF